MSHHSTFMPVVGRVLSQGGADVIKIESPTACDPMRLFSAGTTEPGGAYYVVQELQPRETSGSIDLANEVGQQILYRSVDGCRRLPDE